MENEYKPFLAEVKDVIRHTNAEYTFRMAYDGPVRPGQFFELSIPKYGEAPISVSGISDGLIDFTIRKVGRVTNEIFENYVGSTMFLRGPYGNGFDADHFKDKEVVIVAGGTGVSPVRGVIEYLVEHAEDPAQIHVIAGFKSPKDILFRNDFKRWKDEMDITLTIDAGDPTEEYQVGLVTAFIPGLSLKDVDQAEAIVVGPPAMMRFSCAALLKRGIAEDHIWISQERKMCCGLGKCGHCKVNDTYICLDGPVFNYTKGKTLID
jgi:anaerobic sulfite reductase subunit B